MSLRHVICVGLNHKTAPVAVRERLSSAIPDPASVWDGSATNAFSALREVAMLSTCNRVELYAVLDPAAINGHELLSALIQDGGLAGVPALNELLYEHRGRDAARHLARVASGLDSLVLGEPQILGQVTQVYDRGARANTIGPVLDAVFRTAIRAGKRAHSESRISSHALSIGSAAIALGERIIGNVSGWRVLVVGAGEMGRLVLKSLHNRGVSDIAIANRSRVSAERLAVAWGARAYTLQDLPQAIAKADVVISATRAHHTIIDVDTLASHSLGRSKPLIIVDLAVPRDVDGRVNTLPGVDLFDIDDLRAGSDEALAARREEIPGVQSIIAEELATLELEMNELAIRPLIAALRRKAERIRKQEVARTLHFLGDDLDPEQVAHVQHLSNSLVNKLLHEPTLRLRRQASNGQVAVHAEIMRDLFNLSRSVVEKEGS